MPRIVHTAVGAHLVVVRGVSGPHLSGGKDNQKDPRRVAVIGMDLMMKNEGSTASDE